MISLGLIALIVGGLLVIIAIAFAAGRSSGGGQRDSLMKAPPGLSAKAPRAAQGQTHSTLLSPQQMEEVRAMMAAGQKIEAIKQIRAWTGLGLAEAKDLAEEL